MTAEPGDELAPGATDRGRLRASHADRELVIDTLKAAYVQGRLTTDELIARAGQVFASRTYAELAALTADIPAGTTGIQPPRLPVRERHRPPVKAVIASAAGIVVPATLVVAAFLTNTEPHLVLKRVMVFTLLGWLAVAVTRDVQRRKRSRGQLPPQPGRHGRALGGGQDGGTGDGLILCKVSGDAPARHIAGHRIVQSIWRSLTVRRDQRHAPLVFERVS